jgi:hypothetical protein
MVQYTDRYIDAYGLPDISAAKDLSSLQIRTLGDQSALYSIGRPLIDMASLATDRQYRLRNSIAPTSTVRSGIDPEEDAWGPSDDEKGIRLLGKDLAKSLSVMPSVATYITRSWSANEVSSWKVPQCIVSKWESTAMPPLTHGNVTSIEPKDVTIHESRDRQSEFLRTCHERSDRDLTVLQTPSVAHVAVFGAFEDGPAWYIESSQGRDSRGIVPDGILKIYTTSVFKFRHISPSQDLLSLEMTLWNCR